MEEGGILLERAQEKLNKTVLPGDVIGSISAKQGKLRLGMGLMQNKDSIVATKCGVLRSKGNRYWVENHQKRVYLTKRM